MRLPSRREERRAADRPRAGDVRPCPACAEGLLEFTERFRVSRTATSSIHPIPAWVCDHCPYVVFVRKDHQAAAVRKLARETRVRASRNLMKARFVRGRAERALENSLNRKKAR